MFVRPTTDECFSLLFNYYTILVFVGSLEMKAKLTNFFLMMHDEGMKGK